VTAVLIVGVLVLVFGGIGGMVNGWAGFWFGIGLVALMAVWGWYSSSDHEEEHCETDHFGNVWCM